jgi:hypothetical protein
MLGMRGRRHRYRAAVARSRYRCGACGNLTRFDVTTDRRTLGFHHYSVGGELTVEDEQVLSETAVEVSCRWCGHGRSVEPLEAGVGIELEAGEAPA